MRKKFDICLLLAVLSSQTTPQECMSIGTQCESLPVREIGEHIQIIRLNECAATTPPRHSLAARVRMPRVGTKRCRGLASIAHYEASRHERGFACLEKDSEDSRKETLQPSTTFEATPPKRRRVSAMHRLSDSDQDLLHFGMEGAQDGDMLGLDVQLETWTPYGKYELDQLHAAAVPTPASTPSSLGPLEVSPTRHFDPICIGFFSPGKTPSKRQGITFPQRLAVMSPSLSSLRHSRAEHTTALMFDDKADLQELLKDALDSGCAVLTAQPCLNT